MPCLSRRSTYLFVLWIFVCGVSRAQEPVYLKLRPDRFQNAQEVEQQAKKQNDSLLLAESWYLYGKTYTFAGDYHTAQRYFLKSLRIQEHRGDSNELSRLYVRLSENYGLMGQPGQALAYATLAFQVARRIRSDKALVRCYNALGRVYESTWNRQGGQALYDTTLGFYQKELDLCYALRDTMGVAESQVSIGTFLAKGHNKQALLYLKQALNLFTLKNKDGVRVKAMASLADAYLTFHELKPAFALLQQAEQFYQNRRLNEYDVRLTLENTFVRYFQTTSQWQKAFTHLKKFNVLERNHILSDRDGAITRLNVEYETEKKEALLRSQKKEIDLQTQNLHLQRRFTYTAAILCLLACGVSVIFFRLYRKNQRVSRWNEELVKEQNHRVKNNLQVVSSLLSLQAKRLTDETAKRAVEESRLRVQSMAIVHQRLYDGAILAEADLTIFIRELVDGVLRTYGYENIHTQFSIDPITLSADKAVPLGLILNELITNACKYAFPYADAPELRITCSLRMNKIIVTVADNGPGLEGPGLERLSWADSHPEKGGWVASDRPTTKQLSRKRSFGMQLIENQAEQLYGIYRFKANEEGKGTLFRMIFGR
jgi:two-component sensor histidine kinase